MRKKGIKVDVIEGNINISESQFNNIIQGIEYRSKKLGVELYGSILAQIESKYHVVAKTFTQCKVSVAINSA